MSGLVLGMAVKLRYAKCWPLVAALLVPIAHSHLSFSQADASAVSNASGLEITYLGNEGVLIAAGEQHVLIDALHGPYSEYVSPPRHELRAMQEGKFPYNGGEVVLVTHVHGDHFSARTVGLHLEHNKSAVLVSSRQVVNSMRSDFAGYDRIRSQVHEVTPPWKQRQSLRVNGVGIDVLGLRHGGEEFHAVQNLGYVVCLGRWTLLHVGDADATEENLRSFNLQQEGIDVAFLPFWYLLTPEGQALVREHIRPKHIIAVHIPHASVSELHKATADIRAAFPDCTIFYTLMQKKQF
jgi:L-ascorbate metabolism protein UlaG (beta-lactamase superfamily)